MPEQTLLYMQKHETKLPCLVIVVFIHDPFHIEELSNIFCDIVADVGMQMTPTQC